MGNVGNVVPKRNGNAPGLSVGELIRLNRDLLARAEQIRRDTRVLVHRSSMERIQRCLTGVFRNPVWALGMAQWVAGTRKHPPQGGVRTRVAPH